MEGCPTVTKSCPNEVPLKQRVRNAVYTARRMKRRYEVWFLRRGQGDGSGAWWFHYLVVSLGRGNWHVTPTARNEFSPFIAGWPKTGSRKEFTGEIFGWKDTPFPGSCACIRISVSH
jgi:hypothetical protein